MPVHPADPPHQTPEIGELVGKLLHLVELLERRVSPMRRMDDQIVPEQDDPGQLAGRQDLVLAVLAGHDDRHLERRPRPIDQLTATVLEDMALPVVEDDPGRPGEINRLPAGA